MCRFGGHTTLPYSVAEHSVRVADLVRAWREPREVILAALLHDAHEIYPPGDVLSPVLRSGSPLAAAAREMSRRAEKVVRSRAGVPEDDLEIVRRADRILCATEMRDLRPEFRPENMPAGIEPLPGRIRPWSASAAREKFWREVCRLAPPGDLRDAGVAELQEIYGKRQRGEYMRISDVKTLFPRFVVDTFEHVLGHVSKAATAAAYIADLIICAAKLAALCPSGEVDLERAVADRMAEKRDYRKQYE